MGGQVVSRAVVVATGVTMAGEREVLGCAVGDSVDEEFWTDFLRSLRERGLGGVRLVISDHHLGLEKAIATVLLGTAWQRCRVHFMRNVLARVPKAHSEMVAAAIRTIFAQPDAEAVAEQFGRIATMLTGEFPEVAALLGDAREDLVAFSASRSSTGASCGRRTPWSGCTGRSSAVATWSGSSPTTPPSNAW